MFILWILIFPSNTSIESSLDQSISIQNKFHFFEVQMHIFIPVTLKQLQATENMLQMHYAFCGKTVKCTCNVNVRISK